MRQTSGIAIESRTSCGLTAALIVGIAFGCVSPPARAQKRAQSNLSIAIPSPLWTRDLVIYEIAPKAFTSPAGPESGTFESLRSRLPYLQDLGITGIWLAGYALAAPHFHFNIWMCYASLDPEQIDPTLGTPEQFKALIEDAHSRGIKMILDVTTHGLVGDSAIVKRHPNWFRGGTYNMADFDWMGGHIDLDDWWVRVWSEYVIRYGIDGFRLDTNIYRPDLWARIRQNAAAAGHPVVIFEEGDTGGLIPGVTDFIEAENMVLGYLPSDTPDQMPQFLEEPNALLANDIPGFYDRVFGRYGGYTVHIDYADRSQAEGTTGRSGQLSVRLDGLRGDWVSRRIGDRTGYSHVYLAKGSGAAGVQVADGLPDLQLTVGGVSDRSINNIIVTDDYNSTDRWELANPDTRTLEYDGQPPTLRLHLSTVSYNSSIALSVHDVAVGRQHPKNPYTARGSRALFGYAFLFTPMIPLFMSGEEFNAVPHPIPYMSPDIFGAKDPGQGAQLYGSMLDWKELDEPAHASMLADVKHMLSIRRQAWGVLAPTVHGEIEPSLIAVSFRSNIAVPVPYMRWAGATGIVVAANRATDSDAHISLNVPIDKLRGSSDRYAITVSAPSGTGLTAVAYGDNA